ncbi:helix-turn-helix domain-containing protein [Vibrio sp. SS-MA-C1-2]|nr:helix-turn-helix domain-containing protein [Vibrio sp. SS-MA-C1-2]
MFDLNEKGVPKSQIVERLSCSRQTFYNALGDN